MDPIIHISDNSEPNKPGFKKIAASIAVGVLLLSIPLGVYLVQRTQVFSPRAVSEPLPTDSPTPLPTITDTPLSTASPTPIPSASPTGSPSPTPFPVPQGKGDGNNDGQINLVDLSILLSNYNRLKSEFDFNSDSVINSLDYGTMIQVLFSKGVIRQ